MFKPGRPLEWIPVVSFKSHRVCSNHEMANFCFARTSFSVSNPIGYVQTEQYLVITIFVKNCFKSHRVCSNYSAFAGFFVEDYVSNPIGYVQTIFHMIGQLSIRNCFKSHRVCSNPASAQGGPCRYRVSNPIGYVQTSTKSPILGHISYV